MPGILIPTASILAVVAGVGHVPGSAAAEPRPTLPQARAQVAALQHQAEEAGEAANDLTQEMKGVRRKITALDADIAAQRGRVDRLRRQIGAMAVADYQHAGMTTTAQLLLSPDPDQFLQQASTAQAFAGQQAAVLRRYQSADGRLADLQTTQQAELQALSAVQAQQNKLKETIDRKLAQAENVLARLTDAERARLAAEDVAELRREEAEAEAERRASRDRERTDADLDDDVPSSGRAKLAVEYALDQIGDPYKWAAAGPNSFDCSGLTMAAWAKAGVSLPHSSKAQYNEGRRISRANLQPGDLLFYYTPISHVSMYIGNGKAVHASRPGKPVQIDPAFGQMPYVGAVRPG